MTRGYFILFILLLPFLAFAQSRKDTIYVGHTSSPPFVIINSGEMQGITVWLWEQIATEQNLIYKYVRLPFRSMLDSLHTGAIDLSINPLTITSSRIRDFDFTLPFYASHSIVVKDKKTTTQRIFGMLRSIFSMNFWSGFTILLLFIFFFGSLIWQFERHKNKEAFREGWKGLWDGIWWSVVTMTTVGYGDKTPKTQGGKIIALIWMFSGLLFISGLTASVASSLTVDKLHSDTSNWKDYKERAVGTVGHTSTEQYLKDHFFRNIRAFPGTNAGLDALINKEIDAFIYDHPILMHRITNVPEYRNLTVLPSSFKSEFYAFGINKNHTKLRDLISQEIISLTERSDWQDVLKEYGIEDK